jgi:hypothetical protein
LELIQPEEAKKVKNLSDINDMNVNLLGYCDGIGLSGGQAIQCKDHVNFVFDTLRGAIRRGTKLKEIDEREVWEKITTRVTSPMKRGESIHLQTQVELILKDLEIDEELIKELIDQTLWEEDLLKQEKEELKQYL